ncbi:MAG: oligosaccharide flippase family protein [Bacteroidales bacterium]|nr:oligosaccharide flippase family protein [Bacteroidales bacterium]
MIYFSKRKTPFLRDISKLVAGAGIGQAISLAIAPMLTRLYSPTDFGVYTFFISIAGGFGLIATLRYEMAIILQKRQTEAIGMTVLSFVITFLIASILMIGIIILILFFPKISGEGVMRQLIYFLPLLVLLIGAGNILQHWFNRQRKYSMIAIGKVINSLGNNGGMLVLGILGMGVWGLVGGFIFGMSLFVLFFLLLFIFTDRYVLNDLRISSFPPLIKKHRDLPLANSPQVVLEMLQSYGVIYLAKFFFDTAVVGWYSLAMRIMQAPLILIGSSISQVLYKDAAEQYKTTGQIHDIVWKTLKLSALIALPVLLVLFIAGPWLFELIFGEIWRVSGMYVRILAPWMFFDFIRYSISQIPLIVKRTRSMFYISMAGNGLMILSMCAGGLYFKDVMTGFILLSVSMSLYAIGAIIWILAITKSGKI